MEDKFQKHKMQGLADRDITGVDDFQRDILAQNKFDLMNPKIKPKVASLSTTMGLELNESNMLAEVNLGKIKIKKENEIFLSEVDPNNIPEYYNIVFDYQKQMSLVGRKIQNPAGQGGGEEERGEMKISTRKAFEEKTQKQISEQIIGVGMDPFVNPRLAWKQILLALAVTFVLSMPVIETMVQMDQCLDSIRQIESERMIQLSKIKRQALGGAILSNPDMRLIE